MKLWMTGLLLLNLNLSFAQCLKSDSYALDKLRFNFNGSKLSASTTEDIKNYNVEVTLMPSDEVSAFDKKQTEIFPYLDDSEKREKYLLFEIKFLSAQEKICARKLLAINPLKLCKRGNEYEKWRFHRSHDDSLSVLGEKVKVLGNPYLKNSTICGNTEINNFVTVEDSIVKGWGDGEGKLFLEGLQYTTSIREGSVLEGYMAIKESVHIKNSTLKGNGSIIGTNEGTYGGIFIETSQLSSDLTLFGNIHFSGVHLTGKATVSGQDIQSHYTTFEGEITISGYNIGIWQSQVQGNSQFLTNDLTDDISVSNTKIIGDANIHSDKLFMKDVDINGSPEIYGTLEIFRTQISGNGKYSGVEGTTVNTLYSPYELVVSGDNTNFQGKYRLFKSVDNLLINGYDIGVVINNDAGILGSNASINGSVTLATNASVSNGAIVEGVLESNCTYYCNGLNILYSNISGENTIARGFGRIYSSDITDGARVTLNKGNNESVRDGSYFSNISISGFTVIGHVMTDYSGPYVITQDLFGNIICEAVYGCH